MPNTWETVKAGAEVVQEAYNAATDPDGYFFPRIQAAISRDVAVKLLDAWKSTKILNMKAKGASNQEILAINGMYSQKLAEINQKFLGTPTGGSNTKLITVVIAVGVLGLAFWMYASRKGKK